MDKQTALEILIANACCVTVPEVLGCDYCPLENKGECKTYDNGDVVEAVKVLKGGLDR